MTAETDLAAARGCDGAARGVGEAERGADPAETPFELPDRPGFEWNRTTAKALGIQIPPDVLLRVTTFVD